MTSEPRTSKAPAKPVPIGRQRRPGASRVRRVQELHRGNVRALRHGVFAEVLNRPDVATEAALIFAARPSLDPIRDARLVELLATTNVQRQRAIAAMERDGMSAQLTSYDARLAALVERLERAVHERERERLKDARATEQAADLSRFSVARGRGA